ncbi:MAG: tetratricopeptide repeat protein [candidate division Zixibacteria bacterium]|nr:tetratricopeptide repeat protein [candidate division Zixibacteria bacterium]
MNTKRVWHRTSKVLLAAILLTAAGCSASKPKTPADGSPEQARSGIDPMAYQYFSIASMAYSEGDYQSAIAGFERALRLDPESRQIRFGLAQSYARMNLPDRAIALASAIQPPDTKTLEFLGECYRKVLDYDVRLDTTSAEAYWYLYRLAAGQGHSEEAISSLTRAAKLRGDPRLFVELGELCARTGKLNLAASAFEESLRRDSTAANRSAYSGLAQTFESRALMDSARLTYRRAIRNNPEDVVAHKLLVNYFLVHEMLDSAAVEVERVLDMTPEDTGEKLRLGMLWYNTNRQEKAESLFTQLQNDSVQYVPTLYLGRLAFDHRDYKKAKEYFRKAIASADTIPDAWMFLANTLLNEDSLAAAVATGIAAGEKVNDTRQVWYFVGRAYARFERYDSAVVWFEKAYKLDSNDTRIQFALASSLERNGHFDRSADLFNDLLRHEPDNAPALNYLGYMYADSGIRLDESLKLIERALKQEPENGAYLDSFGWALYRLGRYQDAETQLRKAIGYLKADSTLFDHLGDILNAQGRHEEAQKQWLEALKLKPDDPGLKAKLK